MKETAKNIRGQKMEEEHENIALNIAENRHISWMDSANSETLCGEKTVMFL